MELTPSPDCSPCSEEAFELIDRKEAHLDEQALASLRSWLCPTSYDSTSSEFHRHLSSLVPDTGQWILQTPLYQRWHQGAHGSLWIKGPPGSGKSVLAASLVQRLHQECPVLHFFFRYIIAVNRHSRSLIQDWLAQLLPYSIRLQGRLQPLMSGRLNDLSSDTLWIYLLDGLASLDKVYCVVDALDEMEYNEDFLRQLNELATFRPDSVKMVWTSRPKQYLQRALAAPTIHINLQQQLVDTDIYKFVAYRTQETELTARIVERSNGLFLFARLLLDQLDQDSDINLDTIPTGLEEIYHNTLSKQLSKLRIEAAVQNFLLKLITHCARPLRLNEATDILAFKFELKDAKVVARSACGPLIEIIEDETMQVIHHSFTEFLLGDSRLSPQLDTICIHKTLMVDCLAYLRKALEPQSSTKISPFAEYASLYWPFHAQKSDPSESEYCATVAKFCQSAAFEVWLTTEWPKLTQSSRKQQPNKWKESAVPTALHIAAFAGMTQFARTLSVPIDQRDADGRTPLWWAAYRGHASMVSYLIERGADANVEDLESNSPILEAAKQNHSEVVRGLLEAGVDPLVSKPRIKFGQADKDAPHETVIELASTRGHVDTIRVMIPYVQQETLTAAMCMCAAHGRSEAMEVVLKTIKDVNGIFWDACALHNAVHALSIPCIKVLLEHGANPDLKGQLFGCTKHPECNARRVKARTPLHVAASVWSEDTKTANRTILKLLLEAGANLELRDSNDETPLASILSRNGNGPLFPAVVALIEAGADVTTTIKGSPFLHKFLQNARDISMTETILSKGGDIQARDSAGRTVWHALTFNPSAQKGPESFCSMVEYLLGKEVPPIDVEISESVYNNPSIKIACMRDQLEALKLVINRWPAKAQQCLWHISHQNKLREYLQVLIDAGVDLEVPEKGRTILLDSVNKPFLEHLVEHGARLDAVDEQKQGALHYYVKGGQVSVSRFQWLLSQGVDPKAVDVNGDTILHSATAAQPPEHSKHFALWHEILKYVSPTAQNNKGYTPLHLYLQRQKGRYKFELIQLLGTFDIGDNDGLTPLHIVAMLNEGLTAKILPLADISIRTNGGESVLHVAARARQGKIVALLLPHIRDTACNMGRTALHIACRSGLPEVVALLLKAGSDVSAKDSNGRTPLHACAEAILEQKHWFLIRHDQLADRFRPYDIYNYWDSSKLAQDMQLVERQLVNAGAVATFDKQHHTPFQLAKAYGFPEGMPLSYSPDPERIVMYPVGYRSGPPSPVDEDGLFQRLRTAARTGNVLAFDSMIDLAPIEQGWYESCLHLACKREEPSLLLLECLVTKGVDINGRAMVSAGSDKLEPGPTALHILATANHWWHLDAMRFLITKGADINARNEKGQTPLHVAIGKPAKKYNPPQRTCGGGFYDKRANPDASAGLFAKESTQLLLGLGSDINVVDRNGQSPLHRAAGKPSLMHLMLDLCRDQINQALFATIQTQDIETLNILLDEGADPDGIDANPWEAFRYQEFRSDPLVHCSRNALLVACYTGDRDEKVPFAVPVIQSLIHHGANVFAPVNKHTSILHFVFEHAEYGLLEAFFGHNLDFNQRDQEGRSVLMAAAKSEARWSNIYARIERFQHQKPFTQLLDAGADLHAVNSGRNVLHYMLENPKLYNGIILDLLDRTDAPRLLTRDHCGQTLLHYALRILRPSVCRKLIDMGCALEPDNDQLTALHHIARQYLKPTYDVDFTVYLRWIPYAGGCLKLWQQCIELGADINARDNYGSPPLFHFLMAAQNLTRVEQNCHIDAFARLFPPAIEANLDMKARNKAGSTALHIIAARPQRKDSNNHDATLFEFFVKKGLDPLVEDGQGQSALDVAAANKKMEILKLYQHDS